MTRSDDEQGRGQPGGLAGPQPPDLLAEALPAALGPFFRLIRRATAAEFDHPRLPDAQVDVLRLVQHRPGAGVGEVAHELRLAPNTVSTLVRELVESGLLRRAPGRSDRRTSVLHLTPAADARLEAWGVHRRAVLGEALARLTPDERRALEAALPALRRLQELLGGR